jgi:hypothetical protein
MNRFVDILLEEIDHKNVDNHFNQIKKELGYGK